MSTQTRIKEASESVQEKGFSITSIPVQRFTDWNGGEAVAHKPENRRDDVLLDQPTMEMGNRTELAYDAPGVSLPSMSHSINGKSLYHRLDSHNRDNWWQHREDSTVSKSADDEFKRYFMFAFGCELGLNNLQNIRAFRQLMRLDLRRGTGRTELNGFIICSLVANKDAEKYGSEKVYHPQRSAENNDDAFQRLEDALTGRFPRITKSKLTKVYNKLSQGNPPTRSRSKWKRVVEQESKTTDSSSAKPASYDPRPEADESN
ncbi:hypothetical protein D3D01_16770 [Haloarcula sp. Atlit-7R]|nr:hypothetical protein D3D01_16770 [Haloarcula sp. Atlit-7R]